jgi:hypothetical protein
MIANAVTGASSRRSTGSFTSAAYSVTATGATEITATITTASTYVGLEWGVSGYQWSAFDAEAGTSHTIVLNATDGIAGSTTYSWRFYETSDPLDAPSSRTYTYSGTVST